MRNHEEELGAAIEYAAGKLPNEYIIFIEIERLGYSINMKTPELEIIEPNGDCISDDIKELTDRAIKMRREVEFDG